MIQASLVDTWAATAAGAYTLTENSLYTVDAFNDYLDHLTDDGMLTITRWVADGLRLVSLAQEACAQRGLVGGRPARDRPPGSRRDVPAEEDAVHRRRNRAAARGRRPPRLRRALRTGLPSQPATHGRSSRGRLATSSSTAPRPADYARLILAPDREQFYAAYRSDIRPTTDDRPFFFHTTKIEDQFDVAFGQKMLFGNGLSALMTLLGISAALVVLFVIRPLILAGRGQERPSGWLAWLVYLGALGAGFMLIEVSVLQRFVLLLGIVTSVGRAVNSRLTANPWMTLVPCPVCDALAIDRTGR